MSAFDSWLEAPYTAAARRQEEFEAWASENRPALDWDDEAELQAAWEAFDAFLTDFDWEGPTEPDEPDYDEKAELDAADREAHQDWGRYGW